MGPVVQVVSLSTAVAVAGALLLCTAGAVALVLRRAAHRRRAAMDAELARSRAEVNSLARRVEELSDEVVRTRRTADQDREYVITSLSGDHGDALQQLPERTRPPVSQVIEDQLVGALARQPRTSPVRERAVELVVRTVALGHGVRRALSAEVLDRAAAEAHVARRRSRRERKRELREARRLVRTVPSETPQQPASGSDQEVA